MAECLKHNMKVIIDLKSWESPDETINLVTSLYKQMPALRTSALVTSFFPQLLYKLRSSDFKLREEKTSVLRSADPDIICSLSTRPYFLSSTVYEGTDAGLRPRFRGYFCSLRIHHIPITKIFGGCSICCKSHRSRVPLASTKRHLVDGESSKVVKDYPSSYFFQVGLSAVLVHKAMVSKQFVLDWKRKGVGAL